MNATERNTETVNKDDTRLMVKVESEEVSLVNSETVILENQATIVEVNQSPSDNESGTEANNINEDLIEKEIFSDSKWNTKRARKQDVPKRRIKVIPLYADGSDSSGQAEKHFQFFTADRSFKLTALRSDPNIKSPNPFLKIYHAQVADSKWRCNDCGKEFVMKETLEKHKSTIHEGNAPFKCPYCSKGFTMEQSYHAHIYVHTGKRPFECNICSRGFAKKESLIKHMENHNSSNGVAEQSEKCSSGIVEGTPIKFNGQRNEPILKTPNSSQEICQPKLKPFKCEVCRKEYSKKETLEWHKAAIHQGNAPYKCPYCDKSFCMEQSYKAHIFVHTGKRQYECQICSRGFAQKESFTKHMEKHLNPVEVIYKCSLCDKQFTCKNTIAKHEILIHGKESTHKCHVCDKYLPTPSALERHIRTHSGEKPFACDICGKQFKCISAHKAHKISIHGSNSKFGCEVCGKKFPNNGKLRVHKRIHSGEKPFRCNECGKDFNVKGNLQNHEKIHNKEIKETVRKPKSTTKKKKLSSPELDIPSMLSVDEFSVR